MAIKFFFLSEDRLDVDQLKVISTNTETTEHHSFDYLIFKVNVDTKPNAINAGLHKLHAQLGQCTY